MHEIAPLKELNMELLSRKKNGQEYISNKKCTNTET